MSEFKTETEQLESGLIESLSPFPIEGVDPSFMDTPFSGFNARDVIQTPTNPNWVKDKKIGGKSLSYVSGDTVTRLLNKAFLYKWSFYILETRVVESQAKVNKYKKDEAPEPQSSVVQVHGRLVVPGWGVREQWGAQPLSGGADVQEHAFKSASTDAMKKCASMFGIALDLYGQDGMQDLAVGPHDYLTEDEKIVDNLKAKLKKQHKARLEELNKLESQSEQEPKIEQVQQPVQQPVQKPVEQPAQQPVAVQTPSPAQVPVSQKLPETTPQPTPQQPVSAQWQQEDIQGLRDAKKKLNIDPSNNEALNVFTQEFFGMPDATYRNISPENVKDFLHFLSSKY